VRRHRSDREQLLDQDEARERAASAAVLHRQRQPYPALRCELPAERRVEPHPRASPDVGRERGGGRLGEGAHVGPQRLVLLRDCGERECQDHRDAPPAAADALKSAPNR
jgi:hypothetical protein